MAVENTRTSTPLDDSTEDLRGRLQRLADANEMLLADLEMQRQRELGWERERALFRAMIDQVPDYLFVKDLDSRFVVANKMVAADLGLEPEALIGKTDLDLHSPALAARFFADEQQVIASEQPALDIEEFIIHPSGRQKFLSTSKVPLRNSAGEVIGIVGISRDVTERKQAAAQIQHMAHHDALTDLPNRALLMDRLDQAVAKARRDMTAVAVIFLDLDKFKSINDSLGHAIGDRFLKELSARMARSVRASDTVARLSGDEFVILVDEETPERLGRVSSVIERLKAAIAEPVKIDSHMLKVSCSVGISLYPKDGSNPEALITNADAAMYHAKALGRDEVVFYNASMNEESHQRRQLQDGLRRALSRNEFFLDYQPQLDLNTGRVRAVEALLRWTHPELGLVMPAQFIPLAEENGTIVEIGEWVLREACRQQRAWQDADLGLIVVSVNVSARQFREKRFADRVRAAIADYSVEPRFLELELTESMLVDDIEQAVATMRELESLGVRFAIDDFGVGYSSLSALKNFPVARLKMDRSLVDNLARDQRDRSIARAVIAMAKKLELRVIAEGVETDEQLAFLKANQCDEAQGYFVGRPMPPDSIAAIMRSRRIAEDSTRR